MTHAERRDHVSALEDIHALAKQREGVRDNVTYTVRTVFHGANMSLTNFFGARLSGADMSDVNLEGATLVGAYLGGARLNGAVLTGANLSGAEMADSVGLTQAQLNTACGDATTTLPAGMTVPACGNNQ